MEPGFRVARILLLVRGLREKRGWLDERLFWVSNFSHRTSNCGARLASRSATFYKSNSTILRWNLLITFGSGASRVCASSFPL